MKANSNSKSSNRRYGSWLPLLLFVVVLALMFWRSFLPNYVQFSNDGPLGQQMVHWSRLPSALTGMWNDLNSIGTYVGIFTPGISGFLKWSLGPVGYSKFYAPIALLIVGVGAWIFFRASKLSSLAATLGALAAMLNSTAFGDACWGTAAHQVALGMDFLALALIVSNTSESPRWHNWLRLALAGMCVGMNVVEAADIGALYSIFIAAFVFYRAIVEARGTSPVRALRGIGRVALVTAFAGFIAFQTVYSLVGTQIEGISGTAQNTQTKAHHWDWATQWSLPKKETLSLFVPGLFGYKMNTPQNMMPIFRSAYKGGAYWGGIGRSPAIDQFLDEGGQGTPPSGVMRFSGGGCYCGILVCLVAAWSITQLFRRKHAVFTGPQRKTLWFWVIVLALSLPLAWGRFAPFSESSHGFLFYALLYKLPYFSTIRSPIKFLVFFSWAVVILFAYGIHALDQRYLNAPASKFSGPTAQFKFWWKTADPFDRNWSRILAVVFGACVLGALIYSTEKSVLVQYLQKVGFSDSDMAHQIATFSIHQAGWFLLLFAIAGALFTAILTGYFGGKRAKLAMVLLGAFLVFDLGRADLPYVIHWNYKQKYEVGTLNPIVSFLDQKPYEHRVAGLPFRTPQGLGLLNQLYRIEWMQQLFPYYNIQCLDIIQMPRMPENLKAYLQNFMPSSEATEPLIARHWELTNTRYLLGPAGFLNVLNQQLDPKQQRFRIQRRFQIVPKPGVIQPKQLDQLTAVPDAKGPYALFDFTGALPRAKLYGNWQVQTNDQSVLKQLANLSFHPQKTVLVDTPKAGLPMTATNQDSGKVKITSYAPKKIVLTAKATAPAILLLNDKYDPHWRVTVDGKPATLLRCNYIMRGVYLAPGKHTVTFSLSVSNGPLHVTFAALATGFLLFLVFLFAVILPGKDEGLQKQSPRAK